MPDTKEHRPARRQLLLAGLGLPWVLPAQAQAPAAARPLKIGALGVYAMLGDLVGVTVAERPTDTLIKRAAQESVEVRGASFDSVALRTTRDAAAKLLPGARLQFYRSNAPLTPAEQRKVAEDARSGGLPAWIVQTIEQHKLTHVLLLTRANAAANARSDQPGEATVGRADVNGLGFYVDPVTSVRNVNTGVVSEGALTPHVVVQLTLLDVSTAEVVRSQTINDQWLHAPTRNTASPDPWLQMDDRDKVETLRAALERNLQRVLPALLGA